MSQTKVSRETKIKLLNRINLSPQVFDKKTTELLRTLADALERVKKAKSVKYSPSGQSVQQYIDSKNAGTGTSTAWFSTISGRAPQLGETEQVTMSSNPGVQTSEA